MPLARHSGSIKIRTGTRWTILVKLPVALSMDFQTMPADTKPRTLEEKLEMLLRKAIPDASKEEVVAA